MKKAQRIDSIIEIVRLWHKADDRAENAPKSDMRRLPDGTVIHPSLITESV
jgi:hypothetical protein